MRRRRLLAVAAVVAAAVAIPAPGTARDPGAATLASLAGESGRGPADCPIDGVDASAFLLGRSPTTGRDHVIYFGSNAGVM